MPRDESDRWPRLRVVPRREAPPETREGVLKEKAYTFLQHLSVCSTCQAAPLVAALCPEGQSMCITEATDPEYWKARAAETVRGDAGRELLAVLHKKDPTSVGPQLSIGGPAQVVERPDGTRVVVGLDMGAPGGAWTAWALWGPKLVAKPGPVKRAAAVLVRLLRYALRPVLWVGVHVLAPAGAAVLRGLGRFGRALMTCPRYQRNDRGER